MTLSVSAVIATYNRGPELRIALTRLMTQTTPPMEIIVIDDGSTDGTGAMMRAEFPTVRYVRQPHNAGLILARNFGFVNTSGDCILSVDDDSWFEDPDGLARCVAYLERNPEVAAVACNIETRDGLVYFPKGAAPFDVPWYVGCGHLLRRSAVEQVGLYMPNSTARARRRTAACGWSAPDTASSPCPTSWSTTTRARRAASRGWSASTTTATT